MKKQSQFASVWPSIYQKLKSPPPGVNLGSLPSQLPPINKIVIDPGRLSDNAQAIGYVSTEDVDQNGTLDTIHISSPRLEEAMQSAGIPLNQFQNLNQLSNQDLLRVLTPFVELLSHEMGHLKDFKPEQDNPFPGGEGAAESAARSAVQSISASTTNTPNIFIRKEYLMSKKILHSLSKLAEQLDRINATKIADHVDSMLAKYSQQDLSEVGKQPDLTSPDMQGPLQHMHDSMKGKIQPKGDPYTYNFNAKDQTFTVATVPPGKENLVGHVLKPGQPGYHQLMREAIAMGLVKTEPQKTVSLDPQLDEELKQYGLPPAQIITPASLDFLIANKRSKFVQGMSRVADTFEELANQSSDGPAKSMLLENIPQLKNPNLTAREATDIYNGKIKPLLMVLVGPQVTQSIQGTFDLQLSQWKEVEKIQQLKQRVVSVSAKEHPESKPLSNELLQSTNDADDQVTPVESGETKEANLEQLFWLKSNNPFYRSNAKYKDR